DGLIDINRADAAELETLPGVGPVLAARIVDYRESVGGFESIEDLLQVAGIGESILASIRELIRPP
ncbi:MAG: helix-hairpin-helix domain-containing protein, partial [Acidimicrobiia bacterium]|nr:helix-hairpin-helix domain-containing protein [Acidimicrobiia bacterium]